jgi:ElaB/YqjD/DUF883 family membrane-anchored ribosome-binding protein
MPAPESIMNDRTVPASPPPTAQELLLDLKTLLRDTERLATTTLTDRSAEAAMRERIGAARARFVELYSITRDKTLEGARCTDAAIRSNPYPAMAIAVGVGILGGLLLRRSRRSET